MGRSGNEKRNNLLGWPTVSHGKVYRLNPGLNIAT